MFNSVSNLNEEDCFFPLTCGQISNSLVQNWTLQAIECYKINSDCKKCSIDRSKYSFVCQMPKVIDKLLKNGDAPNFDTI